MGTGRDPTRDPWFFSQMCISSQTCYRLHYPARSVVYLACWISSSHPLLDALYVHKPPKSKQCRAPHQHPDCQALRDVGLSNLCSSCWCNRSRGPWQLACHKPLKASAVITHVSDPCLIRLLTPAEHAQPLLNRGKQWSVRRGSCWPDPPHAHQQHVTTASPQLQPARALHRGSRTPGGPQARRHHTAPPPPVHPQPAVHWGGTRPTQTWGPGLVSHRHHCTSRSPMQAATTEDRTSISPRKTDSTEVPHKHPQQAKNPRKCLNPRTLHMLTCRNLLQTPTSMTPTFNSSSPPDQATTIRSSAYSSSYCPRSKHSW